MAIIIVMYFLCAIGIARKLISPAKTDETKSNGITFEQVYDEHFEFVWRSARSFGVSPAAIDDAVQDVFIIVHRRQAELRDIENIKGWLFGIARRVAKDYRRSLQRKGPHVPIEETTIPNQTASPFDDTAKNQALKIVETFADSLSEEKRALFVLSEIQQLRAPEIAKILDINLNTTYSRLKVIKHEFGIAVSKITSQNKGGNHG